MEKIRCGWPSNDELMIRYHDEEWGVPVHDDTKWYQKILLDGFQAGLSWKTILHKRENFRKAFDNFEYNKIANYDAEKLSSLMQDTGIIRNKLKISSSVSNAQAFMKVQKEFGSFDKYIWQFVGNKPIDNKQKSLDNMPVTSKESDELSTDLKKRGFKFVGSTICYAFMQSAGMFNDHTIECFRHKEV